jgi:hypothetical protein
MIGDRCEEHLGHVGSINPSPDRRDNTPLSSFAVPDLDKAPEPPHERWKIRRGTGERPELESRGGTGDFSGDGGETVVKGAGSILSLKIGEQIAHTGQDCQPLAPSGLTVSGTKLEAHAYRFRGPICRLHERNDRLGDD